jgi:hypothetical protein
VVTCSFGTIQIESIACRLLCYSDRGPSAYGCEVLVIPTASHDFILFEHGVLHDPHLLHALLVDQDLLRQLLFQRLHALLQRLLVHYQFLLSVLSFSLLISQEVHHAMPRVAGALRVPVVGVRVEIRVLVGKRRLEELVLALYE